MIIRIHKPSKQNNSVNDNQGSSEALFDYLDKENIGKELTEKQFFFNDKSDAIGNTKAMRMIDTNHKGLKKADAKFYMLTINPSKHELDQLGNDLKKLQEYTKGVMDEYALGFNRLNADGDKLRGKDLLYFAKIEQNRTYKHGDHKHTEAYQHNAKITKEIRTLEISIENLNSQQKIAAEVKIKQLNNQYIRNTDDAIIKVGAKKDGLQTHIHVVISRKDITGRTSLSPFANARQAKNTLNGRKVAIGFDREAFIRRCESRFDHQFNYLRTPDQAMFALKDASLSPVNMARNLILKTIDQDRSLRNSINAVSTLRNPLQAIVSKASQELAGKIVSGAIPAKIPADLIRKAITKSISMVLKAAELGI